MTEKNYFLEELKKFVGQAAIVTYYIGDKIERLEGIVKALHYSTLSLVLMTEDEKILIRNFVKVQRKRQKGRS